MARVPKIYWPKVSSRQTYAADYLLFKKGQGLAERTLDDMDYHLNRLKKAVLPRLDDETELRQCVMQYFADSASAAPTTFNIR